MENLRSLFLVPRMSLLSLVSFHDAQYSQLILQCALFEVKCFIWK